jgi:serine/threonine protein phosphatase PrpC
MESAQTELRSSGITRPVPAEPATWPDGIVINHEHKPEGAGEDAPPIMAGNSAHGMIGVFDGLGGAGGKTVELADGPERTNAWLASRRAREIVLEVYDQLISRTHTAKSVPSSGNHDGQAIELSEIGPPFDFTDELKRALQEGLTSYAAEIGAGGSGRLKSPLIKTLPTTMAICTFDLHSHEYTAIWAGDSRVYCLYPDAGLQQVTTDDLKTNPDALQNLTRDAIMSNCVSASADFVLRERRRDMLSPCVLIAATDGCFGYLHTPLHFEHMLLSTMRESRSFSQWQDRLEAAIIQVTGDDSTLAAVAIGWPNFPTLRKRFADRSQWCAKRVEALDAKRGQVDRLEKEFGRAREELTTLTQEQWDEYRSRYELLTQGLTRVVPKRQGGGQPAKPRPAREDMGDDGEES